MATTTITTTQPKWSLYIIIFTWVFTGPRLIQAHKDEHGIRGSIRGSQTILITVKVTDSPFSYTHQCISLLYRNLINNQYTIEKLLFDNIVFLTTRFIAVLSLETCCELSIVSKSYLIFCIRFTIIRRIIFIAQR